MKHFRDFSSNHKRVKALKYERNRYSPTIRTIKDWFEVINDTIFNNALRPFDKIIVKSMGDYHAMFSWFDDNTTMLEIHRSFENEKVFVEILAHEMVHLYQGIHDEPVDHGPTFRKWREKFMHVGLTLHRTF